MIVSVDFASTTVREFPVAGKNFLRASALIDNRIDHESRIDHRCDAFALFIDRITVKLPRGHARAAAATLEIQRQHVRGFDCFRRSQPGTNRFSASGKAREIVKTNPAGKNYFRELLNRPVDFDRDAALSY